MCSRGRIVTELCICYWLGLSTNLSWSKESQWRLLSTAMLTNDTDCRARCGSTLCWLAAASSVTRSRSYWLAPAPCTACTAPVTSAWRQSSSSPAPHTRTHTHTHTHTQTRDAHNRTPRHAQSTFTVVVLMAVFRVNISYSVYPPTFSTPVLEVNLWGNWHIKYVCKLANKS